MRLSRSSSARLRSVWTASLPKAVGLAVAGVDQGVRLVDEQDAAEGAVHDLVRLDRGGAEVLPYQVGALYLDDLRVGSSPKA